MLYNSVTKGDETIENEKDTLKLLLYIAKEEFMGKGYQHASLRNIAKKSGLTTGAFYGHSKNKDSLLMK